MFSPHLLFRRSLLLRKALPLFFLLCLVMGSVLFSSCDWSGGDSGGGGTLTGTWSSGSDGYEITSTTLTYISDYGYGFIGNIRDRIEFSPTSGVIIVEYTTPPTAYNPPGKFQGVYYKDLTANSVKLGSAYTVADYTVPVEVTTLALAREKFKLENIALYGGELTAATPQTRQ
ncbi:hypothetical protein LQZ21_04090 [Treponema sp. TIM-1]|uniref:hypothetical protein n=1 Tax=Treponema sp. TIM-1 TaxID=2898417 RepID=UPI00397FE674